MCVCVIRLLLFTMGAEVAYFDLDRRLDSYTLHHVIQSRTLEFQFVEMV